MSSSIRFSIIFISYMRMLYISMLSWKYSPYLTLETLVSDVLEMRYHKETYTTFVFCIGCVEYLEQPTMAFVRLSTGVDLENVVALPIPVRFIFVLLGPSKDDFDYHEIGRSISTLMADEVRY